MIWRTNPLRIRVEIEDVGGHHDLYGVTAKTRPTLSERVDCQCEITIREVKVVELNIVLCVHVRGFRNHTDGSNSLFEFSDSVGHLRNTILPYSHSGRAPWVSWHLTNFNIGFEKHINDKYWSVDSALTAPFSSYWLQTMVSIKHPPSNFMLCVWVRWSSESKYDIETRKVSWYHRCWFITAKSE